MAPKSDHSEKVQALSDAMIREALGTANYTPILEMFCEGLLDLGMSVFRVHIAMSTLHPMAEFVTLTWRRGDGVLTNMVEHGAGERDDWQASPLKTMLDDGARSIRFRQDDLPAAMERYPLLMDLKSEGLAEYAAFGVLFSDEETALEERDGMLASFATDKPGGFEDADIAALERLLPRLGLVAKVSNRERLFVNVLDAYLGKDAGGRVMSGQIALGSGSIIRAVIWFCDLRNSVGLAEKLGPQGFIQLLNDYFEALAGSVIDSGGEVLRFIGDAALAIFPIEEDGASVSEAKAKAVNAARRALSRARDINDTRRAKGLEPFNFGIGLHIGDIMYGNIGVPTRVEFSVIGPAANQAARIESLCKELGEPVLLSEAFREGLDGPWRDLGKRDLRGSGAMRLFGLDT